MQCQTLPSGKNKKTHISYQLTVCKLIQVSAYVKPSVEDWHQAYFGYPSK